MGNIQLSQANGLSTLDLILTPLLLPASSRGCELGLKEATLRYRTLKQARGWAWENCPTCTLCGGGYLPTGLKGP